MTRIERDFSTYGGANASKGETPSGAAPDSDDRRTPARSGSPGGHLARGKSRDPAALSRSRKGGSGASAGDGVPGPPHSSFSRGGCSAGKCPSRRWSPLPAMDDGPRRVTARLGARAEIPAQRRGSHPARTSLGAPDRRRFRDSISDFRDREPPGRAGPGSIRHGQLGQGRSTAENRSGRHAGRQDRTIAAKPSGRIGFRWPLRIALAFKTAQ